MSTTIATDDLAFRKMLIELSQNITKDYLEEIKFMCADQIPRRLLETVTIPLKLWEALVERNLIGPGNLDFLKYILRGNSVGGRTDLLDIVNTYEVDHARVEPSNRQNIHCQETLTDMSDEFDLISSAIGKDWRRLVRKLGTSDSDIDTASEQCPRDVREQIRKLLVLWQKKRGSAASRGELVEALRNCQCNTLATKLERI